MGDVDGCSLRVLVMVSLVGCTTAEMPRLDETAQQISAGQGSKIQGSKIQGPALQGSKIQGTRYDGGAWLYTALAAAKWGTTPVDAEISKASLKFWRAKRSVIGGRWLITGWERRGPASICHYDANRNLDHCNTMGSFGPESPSPIAGTAYQARFRDAGGLEFDATIQIGTSTSDHTAVAFDQSSAMYRLNGTGVTSCSTQYDPGQLMADGTECESPSGCHKNCDLWLYKIYLVDPEVDNGVPYPACGGNGYAIAVPGVYSGNGTRSDGPMTGGEHTQFTFSCLEGTIAKCTQWGYRPWGSATKTCQTAPCGTAPAAVPLLDLHQSCIRAAMADYCTNGTSFTRPGTLVDVWDYEHRVAGKWGLVARTNAPPIPNVSNSAFVFESRFDKHGFYFMDHTRYAEASGVPSGDIQGCNIVPVPDGWARPVNPNTPPHAASTINIDSTTACAHSEFTTGKWLHPNCSPCTQRISQFGGYEHCTAPIGWSPSNPEEAGSWDESCVQLARDRCAGEAWEPPQPLDPFHAVQMASHDECTVGAALNTFDTGCTWRVCSSMPSCCSSSWSSSCVALANGSCYGGQEQGTTGFCGDPNWISWP